MVAHPLLFLPYPESKPNPTLTMKFVILAALIAVALAQTKAPRPAPKKGDFRNEFDHLLMMQAEEGMRKGEEFLLHLTHEIAALEISKLKSEQERIVREIDVTVAFVEGSKALFTRELTRTDLNALERFNFEDVLAIGAVLIKDLKEAEAKVKAIKVHV